MLIKAYIGRSFRSELEMVQLEVFLNTFPINLVLTCELLILLFLLTNFEKLNLLRLYVPYQDCMVSHFWELENAMFKFYMHSIPFHSSKVLFFFFGFVCLRCLFIILWINFKIVTNWTQFACGSMCRKWHWNGPQTTTIVADDTVHVCVCVRGA